MLIDLSNALENELPVDPPAMRPIIKYLDHFATVPTLLGFFPGLAADDLPDGQAWAIEQVQITTHNGTHMDAPWHFHSTMDMGQPALKIDEVPLDWCTGPGVKLDLRHYDDGHVLSAAELAGELDRIGHRLGAGDIVFIQTSAGDRYGTDAYMTSGCGIGREATLFLTAAGVRTVGTDAWSWDAPFSLTAKRYAETRDASLIWEGHKAGRVRGYCQIEKLANLGRLPATGFRVYAFPVKIRAASAGWVRVVAELPEATS